MSELLKKLQKNSTIAESALLRKSMIYDVRDSAPTSVPMINVALSGTLDGGLCSGITMLAGPSKHFKSAFALLLASAYLKKHSDAVLIFYDSEFGTPKTYFESFGIDPDRVLWTPVTDIGELNHDITVQLEQLKKEDHVIFVLDSMGNLASVKESEDALSGKSVADMTRARTFKSLFRQITSKLGLKEFPFIIINHTYQTMEMFSKTVVGGGCVSPEEMILMSDGKLKTIETILQGEYVSTLEGPKKILNVWNHTTLNEGEPECYEVTFDDGSSIICSENHKFLDSDENWIETKEIQLGQQFLTYAST